MSIMKSELVRCIIQRVRKSIGLLFKKEFPLNLSFFDYVFVANKKYVHGVHGFGD